MYSLSDSQLAKVRALINATSNLDDDALALLRMDNKEEFGDTVFSLKNNLTTALQIVKSLDY